MHELVIQLCERLKVEADAIISSMKSGAIVMGSGHENSIETVSLFDGLAIDSVEHCQKIVMSLSKCFFQESKDQKKEGNE